MKTFRTVIATIMIFATMLCLVSCSSAYNAVQSAFEKEGFVENTDFTAVVNAIKEELDREEYAVELHLLTKSGSILSALVIEFKTTTEMVEALEESATLQGLVTDISKDENVNKVYDSLKEHGYAHKNCLIVPLSVLRADTITDIVKGLN